MNGTSTFDKYIKMSWQMVQTDVIMACFAICIMSSMAEFIGLVALLFLVWAMAMIASAAKKTFYTSLYGNGAVTYQGLPVSTEETVIGKAAVMAFASLTVLAVIAAVSIFIAVAAGNETFSAYVARQNGIQYINEFDIPYILVSEIAGAITEHLRMWFVVFAAVVWYNSRPEEKKNGLLKFGAAAGFIAVQWVLGQIGILMTRASGDSYWLPAEAVMIAVNIFISAALYKYIVNRIKKYYELS